MPELFNVARHFDDVSIYDAYSSVFAFKGQFSSFDESSPDGSVARKRTLSLSPALTIPARRTISFLGETWIVGDGNVDGFQDLAIRQSYWMKKSSGLAELVSPLAALNATAGTSLHASFQHSKDVVNSQTESEYDPQWDVYIARTESAAIGKFFRASGALYRVRGLHQEASGFQLSQCDQVDGESFTTATIQSGSSYDPITDTISATNTTLPVILLEPNKFYRYQTKADPKFTTGDMTMLVSTAPKLGTEVTIHTVKWRVQAVQAELDAWAVHIRRV